MLTVFAGLSDISLLLVRLVVALVFGVSGWNHLKNPTKRAESIGMSKGFTIFLGAVEFLGALSLASGILAQYAALGLMLVMLGAMYKKAFTWKTGFWGGTSGWHYDLMLFSMNSVILTLGPGLYSW